MGITASVTESKQNHLARKKSRMIDVELMVEQALEAKNVKLLILGTAECGKSTVIKQMRILRSDGFQDEEREFLKSAIYDNVMTSMHSLLSAMIQLHICFESMENVARAKQLVDQVDCRRGSAVEPLSRRTVLAIKALWQDAGVQEAYERRAEFQLFDSAAYLFDNIERIGQPFYLPSDADIVHARTQTAGIVQHVFNASEHVTLRVIDVGGQRSERRKWIHCFDNVDGVIFITAVNEYDQMLAEDVSMNRLAESLRLFESICETPAFVLTPFILFFNKIDIFKQKIGTSLLNKCFPEVGDQVFDYEQGLSFIEARFCHLNRNKRRQMFTHRTCATDKGQVQTVIDDIWDLFIKNSADKCGIV